jgi:23S rRNA (uracil1939-C5)-methyltransferase
LRRIGGLEAVPAVEMIASPQEYGFRNRLRIHARAGKAGFFAVQSHELVEVEKCLLGSAEVNVQLRRLRGTLRVGKLEDGDHTLSVRPQPFFEQTNDEVAAELVRHARAAAGDQFQRIVDAYCGAGFFARALGAQAREVIGIEQNEIAIAHAARQAGDNERYLAADVADVLGEVLAEGGPELAAQTLVVLDPPAAGLAARVLDHLLATNPARLLYISCHPATLARDLRGLLPQYSLQSVAVFDMFPQTAEIEVMVCLDLK